MSKARVRSATCTLCGGVFDTAEELLDHDCEDTRPDGGHVSTREGGDPPELDHLDAATHHIFPARAAYPGGATDEGDFGTRQAAQHIEAVLDGGDA